MRAGSWPEATLGDVVEFLDHRRRPITASDREPGPYPYYGANGQQDSVAGYLFDERLVLLAEDGGHFDEPGRGIAYRVEGRCWVNNHAHVLRPSERVDWGFLARVLENANVKQHISGTTRAKLTKAGASGISIPLPPIEEQRRIAAILDKADELRAKRRAALAHLDCLTQSIFLDMFGSGGGDEVVSLGSIADVQGGLQLSGGRSSSPIDIQYLRVANVQRGRIDLGEVKSLRATVSEIARTRLVPGDVLLVEGHGNPLEIGRAAAWDGSIAPCVHQNHLIRARPGPRVVSRYLVDYLNSDHGRRHLLKAANTTSGLNTISVSVVKATPLNLPALTEQIDYERACREVDVCRARLSEALTATDELFASLQQRAFSGAL